mmetsp:Transcript_64190/g.182086  ORF Transcript_64190/g.182086 Transcript_64190/m.182086 type:complete len:360 (-) Transcript_64190:693-1772(-)
MVGPREVQHLAREGQQVQELRVRLLQHLGERENGHAVLHLLVQPVLLLREVVDGRQEVVLAEQADDRVRTPAAPHGGGARGLVLQERGLAEEVPASPDGGHGCAVLHDVDLPREKDCHLAGAVVLLEDQLPRLEDAELHVGCDSLDQLVAVPHEESSSLHGLQQARHHHTASVRDDPPPEDLHLVMEAEVEARQLALWALVHRKVAAARPRTHGGLVLRAPLLRDRDPHGHQVPRQQPHRRQPRQEAALPEVAHEDLAAVRVDEHGLGHAAGDDHEAAIAIVAGPAHLAAALALAVLHRPQQARDRHLEAHGAAAQHLAVLQGVQRRLLAQLHLAQGRPADLVGLEVFHLRGGRSLASR